MTLMCIGASKNNFVFEEDQVYKWPIHDELDWL